MYIKIVFILVFCTFSSSSFSELTNQQKKDLAEAIVKSNAKSNLNGWKSIFLVCEHSENNPIDEEICDRTKTNARFLANASRLKLVVTGSWSEVFTQDPKRESIVLVLKIRSTKNSRPSALYAEIKAVAVLDDSIFSNEHSISPWPNKRITGITELWSESVIGASSEDLNALILSFSSSLEQFLKQFFSDYLDANQTK